MKILLGILAWFFLLVFCWPVALLALVLLPLAWLVLLPFRLGYWAVEACLALVKAILFLPARLLGSRGS